MASSGGKLKELRTLYINERYLLHANSNGLFFGICLSFVTSPCLGHVFIALSVNISVPDILKAYFQAQVFLILKNATQGHQQSILKNDPLHILRKKLELDPASYDLAEAAYLVANDLMPSFLSDAKMAGWSITRAPFALAPWRMVDPSDRK